MAATNKLDLTATRVCYVAVCVLSLLVAALFPSTALASDVGDEVAIQGSNICYVVTDSANHKVQVGNGSDALLNGLKSVDGITATETGGADVTIPATVTDSDGQTWTVDKIAKNAFASSSTAWVKSVTINADLSDIGECAFSGDDGKNNPQITYADNVTITRCNIHAFDKVKGAVVFPRAEIYATQTDASVEATKGIMGPKITSITYPVGSSGELCVSNANVNTYLAKNTSIYVLSPTVRLTYFSNISSNTVNLHAWSGSALATDWQNTSIVNSNRRAALPLRYIAVFSDSLSPEGVKDSTGQQLTFESNVALLGRAGSSGAFTTALENGAEFQWTTDGASFRVQGLRAPSATWNAAAGTDYTVKYFDLYGKELQTAPTDTGTYQVQFIGTGLGAWGESEKIAYTITGIDISDTYELSYDEIATAFLYNAGGQAPAIAVTNDSKVFNDYSITYVSNTLVDGLVYVNSEKPALPGKYSALVVVKAPYKADSVNNVLGVVPFEITNVSLNAIEAPNVALNEGAATPDVLVYDAGGKLVDGSNNAYTVTYYNSNGDSLEASSITSSGTYKVKATGDGKGCAGEVEASFTVVEGAKKITSLATDATEYTYSGAKIEPTYTVKAGEATVDSANYDIRIFDSEGAPVDADDLIAAGAYTAKAVAKGSEYAGVATSESFSIKVAEEDVSVAFSRTAYDFIPTNFLDPDVSYDSSSTHYALRGEYTCPKPTVMFKGATLTEGKDYTLSYSNNTSNTVKVAAGQTETATCTVTFLGDYAGTTATASFTIAQSTRIVEYKGVKLRYAVDVDGNAVIVGLGVDVKDATTIAANDASSQADVAKAYADNWDSAYDKTLTIPASISDGDTTYPVTRVADNAFDPWTIITVQGGGNPSATHPDLLNGATKLVIEAGVQEVGRNAFRGNSTVTSIELNEGLVVIGSCAFQDMVKKLEGIVIPSTVKYINMGAFGQHSAEYMGSTIEFAENSQYLGCNEIIVGHSTTDGNTRASADWAPFSNEEQYLNSPLTSITFPASTAPTTSLIAGFNNALDIFFMADTYERVFEPDARLSETEQKVATVNDLTYGPEAGVKLYYDWNRKPNRNLARNIWGWDVVDSPIAGVVSMSALNKNAYSFKPFAVLGNSASDSYVYEHAYDAETGISNAKKSYAANVFIGKPSVSYDAAGNVVIDWGLSTHYVLASTMGNDFVDWMPVQAKEADGSDGDFTVTYVKAAESGSAGEGEALTEITEPGTYEATLTGNGKTCFGAASVTVVVAGQEIADADVTVADGSFAYDGTEHEPVVTVKLGGETLLESGTDYTVAYADNMNAGTATVTVTGQGLYTGEVVKEFDIAQAPLTVTVEDAKKIEGSGDPAFSAVAEGLVGGDELKSAVVKRVDGEDAGSYALTPSGGIVMNADGELVTANYDITYVEGTFTIEESTAPTQEDLETAQNAATAANAAAAEANAAAEAANAAAAAEKEKAEAANAAAAEAEAAAEAAKADAAAEKERADAANAAAEAARQEAEELQAALAAANAVAMNRLYNPNTGEHFYTADVDEVANLVKAGWAYEGEGWTAPEKSDTPVYRLYNPNAGDHHYTTDVTERDNLVKVGWSDEGIGWYSDDAKTVALYRLYNPNAKAGAHHYTLSAEERDSLVQIGWRDEEIGWYGL